MNVSIASTGQTKFGKDERTIDDLMLEACNKLFLNVDNIDLKSIDAIYISNFSSSFTEQCHLPSVLAQGLKINLEIIRVESACASGGLALKEAAIALKSGLYKNIIVLGVEKMTETPIDLATQIIARAAGKNERRYGTTFPSLYALIAQRHFYEYHTNEEHLAKIAVKNHKNAFKNPYAQFHKIITVDDVLNSRTIASPLKLLDCSPVTDGAAAVLLCNKDDVKKYSDTPVHLVGLGHDTDSIDLYTRKDLTSMLPVIRASRRAFKMSALNPQKIDFAELHDCFTIAELVQMEDIGFCKKGEGKKMIEEGQTEVDGDLPINPSGGLKGKGHPIGATGISQIVEIVKQLSGDCEGETVKDAEHGLACNIGGSGASAIVSIFSR